jgi:16S rRNA (guanine1207-N2)-methyltransferase
VTPADVLADHHRLHRLTWRVGDLEVAVRSKVGVRGHPGVDGALVALGEALRRGRVPLEGRVLDLSGAPAALPAWAAATGLEARWTVAATSAATLAAARATLADAGLGTVDLDALGDGAGSRAVELGAALPWEVAGPFEAIVWRPPADRGRRRVAAELAAAARLIAPGGTVWALQHKAEGAKRGEQAAAARFGSVEVVGRHAGWRLAALRDPLPDAVGEAIEEAPTWATFEGPGGPVEAVVGSFAAEKLDPGTRVLLAALAAAPAARAAPARVLDLGCGTGLLARHALDVGATEVLAVDDDLGAVRSAERQLAGDPRARVVHADLTAGVAPLGVDAVWCNPPFHVGRQVVGALSRAFVAAAHEALRPDGEAWFVANRALPYEAELAGWGAWGDATPPGEGAFKVLWGRRGA